MPGKTNILSIAVSVMSLAFGGTCFGADLPKLPSMTEVLNARWNEQALASLGKFNQKPQKALWEDGYYRRIYIQCCHCGLSYTPIPIPPLPPCSKNSLPDEPTSNILDALTSCTGFRMLSLSSVGPVTGDITGISKGFLYQNYLITRRIETSDAFPMVFVFRWLIDTLQINDTARDFYQESVDDEIDEFRKCSSFTPFVVFEFTGKEWLIVELDLRRCSALVRTKDKWGIYGFDELRAESIEARINDFHELYSESSVTE